MEIRINGSRADITLESERSLGEVLSGIEKWLEASGHCLIGLAVDGRIVTASAIAGIFNLPLERIRTVDVTTGTWAALTLEALYAARVTLDDFAEAPFDEQNRIRNGWEAGAGANFLAEKIPGIHAAINRALRGDGLLPGDVRRLIDERIREIENPGDELDKAGPVVTGIVRRLEDLPLDIQTGKDGRAAETVSLFSTIAEKLFRIFPLLKIQGVDTEAIQVEEAPFRDFIEDFGAAARELLAAYEAKDTVLVGDLAEYELAPRLLKLYVALKTPALSSA